MKYNKNKGFTLLELLVVIAIIGILSTIVMVSLQGARQRAQDASIESYMNQIRDQAEIYYLDEGIYSGMFSEEKISTLMDSIQEHSPSAWGGTTEESYCVWAESVADKDDFCLDPHGEIGWNGLDCEFPGKCE